MTASIRSTTVGIIGAGPAGLTLAHLLHLQGIDSVVLEARPRAYVEGRVRAGIVERAVVALLDEVGLADRLHREALVQERYDIRFRGETIEIPLAELTGHVNTMYPQQELVRDLLAARDAAGAPPLFDAEVVAIDGVDSDAPIVRYHHAGATHTLRCRLVAGADGFHGASRPAIAERVTAYAHEYPSAWLGILADARPPAMVGTYCWHPDGFALHSNRGVHTTRQYLEVPRETSLDEWSDDRIWGELAHRAEADGNPDGGFAVQPGPILERSIAPLRSFVVEPMQAGRLFLLGDAAHVFPPAGAKGLNVAVGDACVLSRAVGAWLHAGRTDLLERYSEECLGRAWQAQRYSYRLTTLLHRLGGDAVEARLQEADLRRLATVPAARAELALASTAVSHFPAQWAWRP